MFPQMHEILNVFWLSLPTMVGASGVSKTYCTLTLKKWYIQKTSGRGTNLYQFVTSPQFVVPLTNNGSITYGLLHGFYGFTFLFQVLKTTTLSNNCDRLFYVIKWLENF